MLNESAVKEIEKVPLSDNIVNQGWGTDLLSRAAWIVHSLAGRIINWFYPKILPLSNYEKDCLLLTYYLSICLFMQLRFYAMLYSNLRNENSVAGHIKCSRGPQVPHVCRKLTHYHVQLTYCHSFVTNG